MSRTSAQCATARKTVAIQSSMVYLLKSELSYKLTVTHPYPLTIIYKLTRAVDAALALALKVRDVKSPTERELRNLREWLKRPKGGNIFLVGQESKIWEGEDTSEYVTLFPQAGSENDAFSLFLGGRLLDLCHSIWGSKRKKVCIFLNYAISHF